MSKPEEESLENQDKTAAAVEEANSSKSVPADNTGNQDAKAPTDTENHTAQLEAPQKSSPDKAATAKNTRENPETSSETKEKPHFTPVSLVSNTPPPSLGATEKLATEEAAKYGRVDAEGHVFVRDGDTEREVGQYADGIPENPLLLYTRRFLDLQAQVDLAQARMPSLKTNDIDATLKSLDKAIDQPMVVGNIASLRERVAKLHELGAARKEELAKEREAAKAKALAQRTKLVQTAEKIAAQDPQRTQWKQSGERLRDLLEKWKEAQRRGPHLDRATEDALWKRFSSSRTAFDRHRKAYFSQLDIKRAEVRAKKEALIKRAEELADSTDWQKTSAAYRGLMTEWKAAGRASRKDDDELWEKFHAAQQKFFDARSEVNAKTDSEEKENLVVKEKLLEQAKALLPIKDLEMVKAAFRDLLDKWDEAGRVPRAEVSRLENGLRNIEQAIAKAEKEAWAKSNPETKARAAGMAGQLEAKIAELEAEIAAAKKAKKDTKKLEEDLTARRSWLEQVRKTAAE